MDDENASFWKKQQTVDTSIGTRPLAALPRRRGDICPPQGVLVKKRFPGLTKVISAEICFIK